MFSDLPANEALDFSITTRDSGGAATGLGLSRMILVEGRDNQVGITVYQNGGDLSALNTFATGMTGQSDVLAMRFQLGAGFHYIFTPVIQASSSSNVALDCGATLFDIGAGHEGAFASGTDATASKAFKAIGTGGFYDLEITYDIACNGTPAAASTWRKVSVQRVASSTVTVE